MMDTTDIQQIQQHCSASTRFMVSKSTKVDDFCLLFARLIIYTYIMHLFKYEPETGLHLTTQSLSQRSNGSRDWWENAMMDTTAVQLLIFFLIQLQLDY